MWRAGFRLAAARGMSRPRCSHLLPVLIPPDPHPAPATLKGRRIQTDAVRLIGDALKLERPESVGNVSRLCEEGKVSEAVEAVDGMADLGLDVPGSVLSKVAEECVRRKSVDDGRKLEEVLWNRGLEMGSHGWNNLIRLYTICGSLEDARRAFSKNVEPDEYSWQAIILAHANLEEGQQAIELYKEMLRRGGKANSHIYVAVLKACASAADLEFGRVVHGQAVESGLECHEIVRNSVVAMYAKCGSMVEAQEQFDALPKKDAAAWSVMIAGYTDAKCFKEALQLVRELQRTVARLEPNRYMLLNMLKACGGAGDVGYGKWVHDNIRQCGLQTDVALGSSLVAMYAKCGSLEEAWAVFQGLPRKTIVSWNAIIGGYGEQGRADRALELFHELQWHGLELRPNNITFLSVLRACTGSLFVEEGRYVHALLTQSDLHTDAAIRSVLVEMHARFGNFEEAYRLFDGLEVKDVFASAAMVHASCAQGDRNTACIRFAEMRRDAGIKRDKDTFLCFLRVCGSLELPRLAAELHQELVESGINVDAEVGAGLVDMYVKCGCLEEARTVFDELLEKDGVSWSELIAGYERLGHEQEAVKLFQSMLQEGVEPNAASCLSVLKVCGGKSLEEVRWIHGEILKSGFESDVDLGNTLVDMYARWGSPNDAQRVFERLPVRTAASYSSMMSGYVRMDRCQEVIDLYHRMQDKENVMPDRATLLSVFKACSRIGALAHGRYAHTQLTKMGSEVNLDSVLGRAIIDMYAECGRLDLAQKFFSTCPTHHLSEWTGMIKGYARHGLGKEAIQLFNDMQEAGRKPDQSTFEALLSGCFQAGLLEEGLLLFESMLEQLDELPTAALYGCIVSLLGRAGYLEAAQEFVTSTVPTPCVDVWMALLASCRAYGEATMGKQAFDAIMQVDPTNAAAHDVMSNIYALNEMQDRVQEIRQKMQDAGISRNQMAGRTWIEVDYKTHSFVVEDEDHPNRYEVYAHLGRLTKGVNSLKARPRPT